MPLTLPATPGTREITWIPQAAVGRSESPFTLKRQTYDYGSSRWKAIVTLIPMTREKASAWMAFFSKLRGQEFYLTDSSKDDVVTSETPTFTNTVASGSSVIATQGWTASQSNLLAAGDWFDVTADNGKKALFQVLDAVSSDGSGNANINVFPNVRTQINSGAALNFTGPKGVFLLDDAPAMRFDFNQLLQGLSFECSQVQ